MKDLQAVCGEKSIIVRTFVIGYLSEDDVPETLQEGVRAFFEEHDAEEGDNPSILISSFEDNCGLQPPSQDVKTWLEPLIQEARSRQIDELTLRRGGPQRHSRNLAVRKRVVRKRVAIRRRNRQNAGQTTN